ncbi:MAG: amidohydrolase family protein [Desulfobacterales bacterium]|nr:amidohydrolase family protein [Desulfobacterales bacterium]
MIIDFHCHLLPNEAGQNRPVSFMQVEDYISCQAENGVDLTVMSNAMIGSLPKVDIRTLDSIKRYHAFAAEWVNRYPQNLVAVACGVPFQGEEFLDEVYTAVKDYGFRGVMINSSFDGQYLDSPACYPFYDLMSELDLPVLLHPPGITLGTEHMCQYRLIEMVGRPWDTTLSLARMICSGVLEKYPRLKIVCAHLGGAITMLAGRLDYGYRLRAAKGFEPWGKDVLTRAPSEYIKMLYVDTVSFHLPALQCALDTVGPEHVVFGTDFPPVNMPLQESIDLIERLPVGEDIKKRIFCENAQNLLHLQ